jgi:hypothetical protein
VAAYSIFSQQSGRYPQSNEERRLGGDGPETAHRFAASQGPGPVRLDVELKAGQAVTEPPTGSDDSGPKSLNHESHE